MINTLQEIRIAIVDDHDMLRDAIRQALQTIDSFQIEILAKHGQDLIEQMEQKEIDLVILDIQMPVMNGMQTLNYLKTCHSDLKVIMLSSLAEEGIIAKYKELGADGYVVKSGAEELVDEIKKVMSRNPEF